MENKINNTTSFEALAALCQNWTDDSGIELTGTYAQMIPVHPLFKLFHAQCRQLRNKK